MQKVSYLGVLLLFVFSCSVIKSGERSISTVAKKENDVSVKEELASKNLTKNNFYIKSIDIEFKNGKSINRFNGSIRFEKPDKYLIALRSRAGIEFSRVFINSDSVFIMDRLKHKIYGGHVRYIHSNFGFPVEVLPVLFGDFIGNCSLREKDKNSGSIKIVDCVISGLNVSYGIDRLEGKPVSVSAEAFDRNEFGAIEYSRFKNNNGFSYPSRIAYFSEVRNISAIFTIKKIEIPWNEKIEFNIGNRSKILELL